MARLRREEEARTYERMIQPQPAAKSLAEPATSTSHATLFAPSAQDIGDDDDITYADVNRQMALIMNILVSILACSVAIWLAASHWSTPKRLGLSMSGSGIVAIAEVVVYAGYLRRIKESKDKSKKEIETKEVIKSWVIGGRTEGTDRTLPIKEKEAKSAARRRNKVKS